MFSGGTLLAACVAAITAAISTLGYAGIVALMAVESACVPLPSEVTMPFAGYLVARGRFDLQLVALAGALGCVLGSYAAYWMGLRGGRPLIARYGSYVLMSGRELEVAERFFARWGQSAVFLGRLLPVVRTFIGFPAGLARMGLAPFTIYSFGGSYLWCLGLAYAGMKLGANWAGLMPYFERFDTVLAAVGVVAVGLFLYRRLRWRPGASGSGVPGGPSSPGARR
ncbi:MAG: DedA family protein [Deltaproteobacteria bacterium]|jgi:membrane protein DedA with SNARE-associated domain|nr:DedA family protein [Deltaproteobacteria bacterium]